MHSDPQEPLRTSDVHKGTKSLLMFSISIHSLGTVEELGEQKCTVYYIKDHSKDNIE